MSYCSELGCWQIACHLHVAGSGGPHDVGGVDSEYGAIDLKEKTYAFWERQTHALLVLLVSKHSMTTDELRRGIEALPAATYEKWGYYEKWAASMASILLERGIIQPQELDRCLGERTGAVEARFKAGDKVRVREEIKGSRWRKPHLRVPGYLFGQQGVIERYCGDFPDPEFLAFRGDAGKMPLYTVRFSQAAVWGKGYHGAADDTVEAEVYQSWLEDNTVDELASSHHHHAHGDSQHHAHSNSAHQHAHSGEHHHDSHHDSHHAHGEQPHSHHHDEHDPNHGHTHDPRIQVEQKAVDKEGAELPGQRVAEALVRCVLEKKLIEPAELRASIERVDAMGTHAEGPTIVARAWMDPVFKELLLKDANAACKQIGISASNTTTATRLLVVENTENVHNVVVCTLCSCYPLSILGLSPPWYKDRRYRARVVREPRKVLEEFGLHLPEHMSVSVHDSTADLRYLVLPRRPAHTENWTEAQLMSVVSRDSMIGVAVPHV